VSEDPRNLPGEPPPDPWPPGPSEGLGFGQNTPISTLPPVVALDGDESIPVVQNNPFGVPVTMRATPVQIAQTLPVNPGAVPQAFAENQTIISGPAPTFSWTPVSFNALPLVATWNGRTGDVTMAAADVTNALGFTPYDAANPQNFQTLTQVLNALAASASNATPLMDGVAAPGSNNQFSRGDHVHPTDTSRYSASNPSNFQTGTQIAALLSNYLPLSGGTVTGGTAFTAGIILATPANLNLGGGSPGNVLTAGASPGQVEWSPSGGGIPDAPTDGQTYGRNTGTWVVVSGGGGISDSPADGTLYGRVNPSWRHIVHTDIQDWTATLAPYALSSSVPVASNVNPLAAGTASPGTFPGWSRGDHVHPAQVIPPPVIISATPPASPVVGTLWWDSVGGQLYVWYDDGTSSQWVIAVNSGASSPAGVLTFNSRAGAVILTTADVAAVSVAPTATTFTATGAGTYTPPAGVRYIRVRMVAGGGGGGGVVGSNAGSNGGNSSFLGWTALGGAGGAGGGASGVGGNGGNGGTGGANGTGNLVLRLPGAIGGSGQNNNTIAGGTLYFPPVGGGGGSTPFGSGAVNRPAIATPSIDTGAGGAGAFSNQLAIGAAGGGGGGEYVEFYVATPTAGAISVGAGGAGGTFGGGGVGGGNGSPGLIIIEEFYT
jgi:hypothetical protein